MAYVVRIALTRVQAGRRSHGLGGPYRPVSALPRSRERTGCAPVARPIGGNLRPGVACWAAPPVSWSLAPGRTLYSYLATFKERVRSGQTQDSVRQIALGFSSWCARTGCILSHKHQAVPKREEGRDWRRVRRALTEEGLGRLVAVVRLRGLEAEYLAAVLAGRRKGDLKRLTWADVDSTQGCLRIRGRKSRPLEIVPTRPGLAEALRENGRRQEPRGDAVLPTAVTDLTPQRDLLRAVLA